MYHAFQKKLCWCLFRFKLNMQSSLLSIIIIPKLSNVDYSTAFLNLGVAKVVTVGSQSYL